MMMMKNNTRSLFYVAYTACLFTDPSAWWHAAEPLKCAMNQGPHLSDQCIVVNIRFQLSASAGDGNGPVQLTDKRCWKKTPTANRHVTRKKHAVNENCILNVVGIITSHLSFIKP